METEKDYSYLTSFVWPHEYYTLQAVLQSNGIEVLMRDEMTIAVDPLLSNAIGGIKMYVKNSDFDLANKIMEDFYKKRKNEK